MLTSSRLLLRRNLIVAQRRFASQGRNVSSVLNNANPSILWFATVAVFASATLALSPMPKTTKLDALPTSGDVILLGATKEKATGILFPKQCNGFTLAGTGVRVKYGFVKVYAVGTYLDPLAMSGIKGQPKDVIQKALLDPMYPRTIRIVMARGLSIKKFTDALNESSKPRMNGEDLHT